METLTNPTPLSDPPPASPRWVLLEPFVNNKDSDPSIPDAKTTAASCTSTGQLFSISFALAPPPAISTYCCDWIGGSPGDGNDNPDEERRRRDFTGRDESKELYILAAHDDCALIQMSLRYPYANTCINYFLYESGAGQTPPLLSLLPSCYHSRQFDRHRDAHDDRRPRSLRDGSTIVLRRGGELIVAELEVIYEDPHDTAELCVLRPGRECWEIMPLTIAHHEDGGELPHYPRMDAAVAVGTRFMCWVDYNCGIFLHDVAADETLSKLLLYIPLPVPLPEEHRRKTDRPYLTYRRNLGAAGLDAVRFVSVDPRCCCGSYGKASCERSRFAFNVTTWTLTLKKEGPMTWVKEGVLDCDELWQLPNYGCLPRVAPRYPIVSSDNPDVICFMLCENHHFIDNADKTEWLLEVDTRSKALLSVIRQDDTRGYRSDHPLPAKLCW